MRVLATSRIEGPRGRKTGWSSFPEDNSSPRTTTQVEDAQGYVFH
jgi:hypothetical protein